MDAQFEYDICDIPFDGYFAPEVKSSPGRFGCPLFARGHFGQYGPGFGPNGPQDFQRFGDNQGPPEGRGQQGPPWGRFGPGWGRFGQQRPPNREGDGPADHFNGPPASELAPESRPQGFNGPNKEHRRSWFWFGRHGPSEAQERGQDRPTGMGGS